MVDGVGRGRFGRGLQKDLVEALNAAYDDGRAWWRNLADDPDVFIAIRDGSVNAYYKGCSLLRLWLESGKIRSEVHYKYLLKPEMERPYVSIVDAAPVIRMPEGFFLSNLSDTASLKRSAAHHAGVEKTGVHAIIKSNSNIVDVEIAFSRDAENDENNAQRIDFAALQEDADAFRLRFFEAKHFSNDDLRSSGDASPRALKQIDRYAKILQSRASALQGAYLRAFGDMLALTQVGSTAPMRDRLMRAACGGEKPFSIDPAPRLVVFGFGADQRDGVNWAPHLKKLRDALGPRLLCRGKAAGFTAGISSRPS